MITCISGWATTEKVWQPLSLPEHTSLKWSDCLNSPPTLEGICIGWSIGGMIALQAAQHSQLKACVLISTTPRQIEDSGFAGVPLETAQGMLHALQENRKALLEQFFTMNLFPNRDLQLHRTLCEQARSIEQSALEQGLSFLQQIDLRKTLGTIEIPTLVIHGTEDVITPFTSAEYLVRSMPNARLSAIEGAGHAALITHAREVSNAIGEFINGL